MAICGFNKKMLDSLENFFDGAIEYGILDRAKNKGISIEAQFQNEFEEISQWLYYSKNIQDGPTQKIVEGIGLLVAGIFEKDLEKGVDEYRANHKSYVHFLKDVDGQFYGPLQGDKNNMPHLFDWANNNLDTYSLESNKTALDELK